jgi:CHAT domain-containing protein
MKLKIFALRSLIITFLVIFLTTSSTMIWNRVVESATPSTANITRSNTNIARRIPQPLDGKKLQSSIDKKDFEDVIRQVELGWQFQYEAYYEGKLSTTFLELTEIQAQLARVDRLTKTKSALLYAVPRPDGLNLLLVTATGTPVHKKVLEANAKTIPDATKALRNNVSQAQTTSAEYLPPAQKLDQWLIQPVTAELKAQKIDTILFCLGTNLRGLPLAALHDGKQFLAERFNLGIIPAFNLVDTRSQPLSGSSLLAMGASTFADNDNLPAVPLELATITDQKSWPGTVLLNEAFTLEKFKQARLRKPYGIVHLATHADISAKSVKDSYIQFWDRRLQLNQIREMQLDQPAVKLLVLSACKTALGTPNAELGFAGLAMQSGARSVLASLWAVNDRGTLVMMSEFYQRLKTTPLKSKALRRTQIAMLKGDLNKAGNLLMRGAAVNDSGMRPVSKDQDLSHPYYWAAFTMIGNPW